MASLNLSTNGPSITKSYQSIVNAPPPNNAASASPTYGQWAVYSVAAPLVSAFQQDGGKESIMKLQTTGEGELVDLIEEFSEGRIQFGFVKVKDPNTTLPKCVLVAWCGEGVPERTKGYFTSHLAAVSKLLHGYHVQITARSDRDLTPEAIIKKVEDSSGSKYSGGGTQPSSGGPPPPVSSKPAFTPTRVGGVGSGFNPLASRSRAPVSGGNVDEDGWGHDAPPVTRSQLEKVASAYQPTKVNLAELTSQKESSRFSPPQPQDDRPGVVKGAYQPIGKVDIAEIRRQAKDGGKYNDDRPAPIKSSYEPVGKVDIAAIRARAQPSSASGMSPAATGTSYRSDEQEDAPPKPLTERSNAFQSSERMTSLPKPKVANKFGGASSFMGTRAPEPSGYTPKTNATAAPVGVASRTFADEGGKTPAQIWAEKKARQSGGPISPADTGNSGTAPVQAQQSGGGGWQSGYSGKSWAPVQIVKPSRTGQSTGSNLSEQRTGQDEPLEQQPSGGISAIRDRFAAAPPPMDMSSKPNAIGRAIPPPRTQARSPSPAEEEEAEYRSSSPVRIAMPVGRSKINELEPPEELDPAPSLPVGSVAKAAAASRDIPAEPQIKEHDPARGAGMAAAESSFGHGASSAAPVASKSGKRALIQYDYEKAEDNEVELKEGEYVTEIEMVDDDWWMGRNSSGETGLFPSNYVDLVEDDEAHDAPAAPGPPAGKPAGPTATAQYDYEAAEDNELSFPDGATVLNVEFPDDDWWFGEYNGKTGLFPANYVVLDE